MAKKLMAKVGTYTNQAGEHKNRWQEIGVEMSNDKGSYFLLDPAINLAGVLAKQNIMAMKAGGEQRERVMVSSFEDQPQQQPQNHGQQQPQQGWGSQTQQQGNPVNQQSPQQQQAPQQARQQQAPDAWGGIPF